MLFIMLIAVASTSLFLGVESTGVTPLSCYVCSTNCSFIQADQVRECFLDSTVCVTTAVTHPDSSATTMTRSCGREFDYSSRFSNTMDQTGKPEHCHGYRESSGRTTRTCICNSKQCNIRDVHRIFYVGAAPASKSNFFLTGFLTVLAAAVIKM